MLRRIVSLESCETEDGVREREWRRGDDLLIRAKVKRWLTAVYRSGRIYMSSGAGKRGCFAYEALVAAENWLTRESEEAIAWQKVSRKILDWWTSHIKM